MISYTDVEFSYNMAGFEPIGDKDWAGIHGFPVKIRDFQFRTQQLPGLILGCVTRNFKIIPKVKVGQWSLWAELRNMLLRFGHEIHLKIGKMYFC